MGDTFATDLGKLQQLSLKTSKTNTIKRQQYNENLMKQELHRRTLLKFALLCRKLNVDPLHEKSIHVVLLLFGKVKDKKRLLEGFLTHPSCKDLEPINVDWQVMSGDEINIHEIFCSMSDWMLILKYLVPAVEPALAEALMQEPLFVRLRQSWKVGGLDTYYPGTVERLMSVFCHMSPTNLSATKMLERLLVGEADSCRDLEFRCLRTTNHFMDVSVDESESLLNMLLVLPCMMTQGHFFGDMKAVLMKEESMTAVHAPANKSTRLQMRFVVKDMESKAKREYTESFESWLGQQKFTVTMSRHLQLLLYFIQVQQTPIPKEKYAIHFTDSMLNRMSEVKVQNIDAAAVISLIKSLRVYHHNVQDLLDFRATCLVGFNQHIRANLSLAQVLQLYVASFQHPSILQTCWKAIVPVWTHTTATSVEQFTRSHAFDYEPVIDSVVQCQVHDSG